MHGAYAAVRRGACMLLVLTLRVNQQQDQRGRHRRSSLLRAVEAALGTEVRCSANVHEANVRRMFGEVREGLGWPTHVFGTRETLQKAFLMRYTPPHALLST